MVIHKYSYCISENIVEISFQTYFFYIINSFFVDIFVCRKTDFTLHHIFFLGVNNIVTVIKRRNIQIRWNFIQTDRLRQLYELVGIYKYSDNVVIFNHLESRFAGNIRLVPSFFTSFIQSI